MLDELREALEREDWPLALEHALAAWRASRSSALAELVDRIGNRCPPRVPPHSRAVFSKWWLQHAEPYDPTAVTSLVATADTRMFSQETAIPAFAARWQATPVYRGCSQYLLTNVKPGHAIHNFVERLAAISRWPDDPRVAPLFARWLFESGTVEVGSYQGVCDWLAQQLCALGDRRVLPVVQRAIDEPRGTEWARTIRTRLAHATLTALPPRDDDPTTDATAIVALLPAERVAPPPAADLDALFREVAEHPADDGVRLVLADAFAVEDPARGELIVAQCGMADKDERRQRRDAQRAHTLIAREGSRWLGDLALVITRRGTHWERGMLHTIRIGQPETPAWAWQKARGHRELSGVEVVRTSSIAPAIYVEFLLALPRSPTTIDVDSPLVVDELVAARRTLPTAHVRLSHDNPTTKSPEGLSMTKWLHDLASCLPALETIEIYGLWPQSLRDELAALAPALPTLWPRFRRARLCNAAVGAERVPDMAALPFVEIFEGWARPPF